MIKKVSLLLLLATLLASCGSIQTQNTTLWMGSGGDNLRRANATGEILAPFGKVWAVEVTGLGIGSVAIASVPNEMEKDNLIGVYRLIYTTGLDGSVSAYEFDFGMKIWEQHLTATNGNILYTNGKIITPCVDGYWYALDAWNGKVVWKTQFSKEPTKYSENSTPAVSGNIVYCVSSNNIILALDVNEGKEVWKAEVKDSIQASPVLVDDILIVSTYEPSVKAYNKNNGKLLWETPTSYPVTSALISNGKLVFAPEAFGVIAAFNVTNGKELWKTDIGGTIPKGSCLWKSMLIVPNGKGEIVALDQVTGKLEFTIKIPDPTSAVVASGDIVCLTTKDGKVTAIDMNKKYSFEAFSFEKMVTVRIPNVGDPAILAGRLIISDGVSKLYMLLPKELAPKEKQEIIPEEKPAPITPPTEIPLPVKPKDL